MKGYRQLKYSDRLMIERMLKTDFTKQQIADALGCSVRTVYYEISRATYIHTNSDLTTEVRYNPDGAEELYQRHLTEKGIEAKLKNDSKTKSYIEKMIADYKYSPEAVLLELQQGTIDTDVEIKSVNTIYTAIEKGYFNRLTLKNLPRRKDKKKKKVRVNKSLRSYGGTIEERDEEILQRMEFGHWEMDTVHGKQSNRKTLLVLTERKTRFEIIEPLKSCTIKEVVRALNRIEKRLGAAFYTVFKTITCDNGVEFRDPEKISKALYRKGDRTKLYYCHPYSSFERGSNENNNILIRRFLPKGSDFDKTVNKSIVKKVQEWMNFYPRKLFDGLSSFDLFDVELKKLNIDIVSKT